MSRKSKSTRKSWHSNAPRLAKRATRRSVASSRKKAQLEPDDLDGNHVSRKVKPEHPRVNAKVSKSLKKVVCDSDGSKEGLNRVLEKTTEDSKFKFADQVSPPDEDDRWMDDVHLGTRPDQLNKSQLAQLALKPPQKRQVLPSKLKWDGDQATFKP